MFNPNDQQDVKLAFDLLKDIWSLSHESTNRNPGVAIAWEVIWILEKVLVFPYVCVNLSLSEQIEYLSQSAHLLLGFYKSADKEFIPTNLYINIMIMTKNVIFCIAKAKVDDPDRQFWIILLGTDYLKEFFVSSRQWLVMMPA